MLKSVWQAFSTSKKYAFCDDSCSVQSTAEPTTIRSTTPMYPSCRPPRWRLMDTVLDTTTPNSNGPPDDGGHDRAAILADSQQCCRQGWAKWGPSANKRSSVPAIDPKRATNFPPNCTLAVRQPAPEWFHWISVASVSHRRGTRETRSPCWYQIHKSHSRSVNAATAAGTLTFTAMGVWPRGWRRRPGLTHNHHHHHQRLCTPAKRIHPLVVWGREADNSYKGTHQSDERTRLDFIRVHGISDQDGGRRGRALPQTNGSRSLRFARASALHCESLY